MTKASAPAIRLEGVVKTFPNPLDAARPIRAVDGISLKAGGLGLNLTAADFVIHMDPWWNPAVESQATDRTHRIGQTRQVFSYKLICQNTVEEKILKLQEAKRGVAEAIIPGQDTWKSLTREDLEMLFEV